jgi:hypothetical protein
LEDIKVDVCLQGFDLLYLNGQSLINDELHVRREKLYASFKEIQGTFMFVQKRDLEEVEEIQAYLNEAVENQTEGLMVKTLDGPDSCYEIAKRSYNWLKVQLSFSNLAGCALLISFIVEKRLPEWHDRLVRLGAYWCMVRQRQAYWFVWSFLAGLLRRRRRRIPNRLQGTYMIHNINMIIYLLLADLQKNLAY